MSPGHHQRCWRNVDFVKHHDERFLEFFDDIVVQRWWEIQSLKEKKKSMKKYPTKGSQQLPEFFSLQTKMADWLHTIISTAYFFKEIKRNVGF